MFLMNIFLSKVKTSIMKENYELVVIEVKEGRILIGLSAFLTTYPRISIILSK